MIKLGEEYANEFEKFFRQQPEKPPFYSHQYFENNLRFTKSEREKISDFHIMRLKLTDSEDKQPLSPYAKGILPIGHPGTPIFKILVTSTPSYMDILKQSWKESEPFNEDIR